MPQYPAIRNPKRRPNHPGADLKEAIEALGRPKTEIAKLLGISRQHLNDILGERKPLSPNVAVRVGKLLGGGPDVWVRLQSAFDTWEAQQEVDVSKIPTLHPAV